MEKNEVGVEQLFHFYQSWLQIKEKTVNMNY